MVTTRRITIVSCLFLIVVFVVVIGFCLVKRIDVSKLTDPKQPIHTVAKVQTHSQATKIPSLIGSLHITSPPTVAAINEAKWPSASEAHDSSPADIFVDTLSALARGDLRAFALAMSKPAQATFLEGRSIDDPYFQGLPQKMAEAGFQSPTVESFKAERINRGCKLTATLSSIRGRRKISEEIMMEFSDSSSGWLIDKYESNTIKIEAITEEE